MVYTCSSKPHSRVCSVVLLLSAAAICCFNVLILHYWESKPFARILRCDESIMKVSLPTASEKRMIEIPDLKDTAIKAAAVMLVGNDFFSNRGGRICYFNKSMDALEQFWYPTNRYPIILQRQDGWNDHDIVKVKTKWPKLPLYFTNVSQQFYVEPPLLLEDKGKLENVNYKRMCRFKTYGFLEAPLIGGLDYIMSLDDDSCISEPISYDVFEEMKEHQAVYAFKQLFLDAASVVTGLWQFVENYLARENLTPANPTLHQYLKGIRTTDEEAHHAWAFSTNLDWIDLKAYRDLRLTKFFSTLDQSAFVFHRRWSDSPLRLALAYMFWNRDQVMKTCTPYYHSFWPHSNRTCNESFIHDSVLTTLQKCPGSTCSGCD